MTEVPTPESTSITSPTAGVGAPTSPVLQVEDLTVEFFTRHSSIRVVEGVTFSLEQGQIYGLVGESGSGKTVTSLAVLGMIGAPVGRISRGSVRLDGRELVGRPNAELRRVRGRDIAMIFQEPKRNLDPAFTVGDQIAETVRAHLRLSRREAWRKAVEMLDMVRIPNAARRAHEYPHQFSGGMAQRVMLAIALSCSPKVLVADEPTTALDVTVQDQVLQLITDLQAELGLSVLFISHDLGVVARMCDQVAVMYAGQIVEQAGTDRVFLNPQHPYTAALLASIPNPEASTGRLVAIPGLVPPSHDWPSGCRFHPRCRHAVDRCMSAPPMLERVSDGGTARCHFAENMTLEGIR